MQNSRTSIAVIILFSALSFILDLDFNIIINFILTLIFILDLNIILFLFTSHLFIHICTLSLWFLSMQ